jgi:hypothetical protein
MTKQNLVPLLFVVSNILILTGFIVFVSFQMYPQDACGLYDRADSLQKLYNKIKEYQIEKNMSPEEVNSVLRYDANDANVFVGDKVVGYHSPYLTNFPETWKFQYYLIDGEPVLVDLGMDGKRGGIGWALDVTYPEKYQKFPSFWQFLKTPHFFKTFFFVLVFSVAISLCLYAMWRRNSLSKVIGIRSIFTSIVFVLFELLCAQIIVLGHVYPHH